MRIPKYLRSRTKRKITRATIVAYSIRELTDKIVLGSVKTIMHRRINEKRPLIRILRKYFLLRFSLPLENPLLSTMIGVLISFFFICIRE